MLVVSIGGSDDNSDYVESAKNSPTSLSNTPDLAGHISELKEMHKVAKGELGDIAGPTVIFSHTNQLEILDLADAKTNLPENHQDNGATPPVNAQPSLPQSLLEDTYVA